MSAHLFDPEIAVEVGVNAAVIYQNIVYWCEKNAANGQHIHEGRAWTYNSVKAFGQLFPYLTQDQIRRAIERLVEAGFVGVGNFGEDARDRTKWFCDLRQSHLAPMPETFGVDAKSYRSDVNTDSKPDKKRGDEAVITLFSADEPAPTKQSDEGFESFWKVYPKRENVSKKNARLRFAQALKKTDADTLISCAKAYAASRVGQESRFTQHPDVWLNQEKWLSWQTESYIDPDIARLRAITARNTGQAAR